MKMSKERLLEETYQNLLDVAFFNKQSIDVFDEIVAADIVGYGTTADENILSLPELQRMMTHQREQSKGIEIRWVVAPFKHRIATDENSAIFADNISFTVFVNNESVEMKMRFSTVFEYVEDRWLLVHFHGSKPENVESEKDTFGIEEWKQQNEKLQRLVDQKTAELKKQKEELEHALHELRSTQQQLIQSDDLFFVHFL